jgi:hypothetical protein
MSHKNGEFARRAYDALSAGDFGGGLAPTRASEPTTRYCGLLAATTR